MPSRYVAVVLAGTTAPPRSPAGEAIPPLNDGKKAVAPSCYIRTATFHISALLDADPVDQSALLNATVMIPIAQAMA